MFFESEFEAKRKLNKRVHITFFRLFSTIAGGIAKTLKYVIIY